MVADDEQGALLTASQRKYIKGESDVEPGTSHARAVESRLRTRLRWGMYDFTLLLGHLAPEERKKVFEEKGEKDGEEGLLGTTPLRTTIIDALGFFYLVLADFDDWWARQERWEERDRYAVAAERFEELLSSGIARAFMSEGESVEEINVDIEIDRGESLSALADMPLEEHPEHVLNQLLEAGEITPTEYGEEQQKRINEKHGLGRTLNPPTETDDVDD